MQLVQNKNRGTSSVSFRSYIKCNYAIILRIYGRSDKDKTSDMLIALSAIMVFKFLIYYGQ